MLTAVVKPDSDQLIRQADLISALIRQRDLLLHQAEEQRLRWNSEKDGWARMAEALLAQQAKNRLDSERDEVSHFVTCISVTGPDFFDVFIGLGVTSNKSHRIMNASNPSKRITRAFANG